MAELKTTQNNASVDDFLNSVQEDQKREDSKTLDKLFQKITGKPPKMWGPSIIGYGLCNYRYKSGREGEWMVAGFSPRKNALTIYLMGGFEGDYISKKIRALGKHTSTSKGCLYIKKLSDVDMKVLEDIIVESVRIVTSGELPYLINE